MKLAVRVADSHQSAAHFVKKGRMNRKFALRSVVTRQPGLTSSTIHRILQVRIGHLSSTESTVHNLARRPERWSFTPLRPFHL
jgi:hypothetical protein